MRVSDVSQVLRITAPSVTKLVNEMVAIDTVNKQTSLTDGRVTILSLTSAGEELIKKYVWQYHSDLANLWQNLEEKDCRIMIDTIKTMYEIMKKNPILIKREKF